MSIQDDKQMENIKIDTYRKEESTHKSDMSGLAGIAAAGAYIAHKNSVEREKEIIKELKKQNRLLEGKKR